MITILRIRGVRVYLATLVALTTMLSLALPALAHPHEADPAHQGDGQELANGQLHAAFSADGTTCGGDPAAYGLESAHHGPDSGTPGKADGCYQVDSMPPGTDDNNPGIK